MRLFEVGGSIRDELLGIEEINDRDFLLVCATWEQAKAWAKSEMSRVFLVVDEHHTIRGVKDGSPIDVTWSEDLMKDLSRRDFTCNAIARCVDSGEVFDPHNGKDSISSGVLLSVSDRSFHNDWVRLLRSVRFCAVKGFRPSAAVSRVTMDEASWSSLVESVSIERIRQELQKGFKANTPNMMEWLIRDCHSSAIWKLFDSVPHGLGIRLEPTTKRK